MMLSAAVKLLWLWATLPFLLVWHIVKMVRLRRRWSKMQRLVAIEDGLHARETSLRLAKFQKVLTRINSPDRRN